MQTKLSWKKKFFSNIYNFYSNDQELGFLKEKSFSYFANAELNGKAYIFKTKGNFKQYTEIIDPTGYNVIGKITYSNWMTKATITIDDRIYTWKYDNFWGTKWKVYMSDETIIKYAGSSSKGQIDSSTDDALLLLSGFFVTSFYWQMTMIVVLISLIPIWTTALH